VREVDGLTVPTAGVFDLDVAHTRLGFVARHLMVTKVRGSFADFDGSITIGEDLLDSGAEVRARTQSITTNNAQRDGHLQSSDFFEVGQHPEMTYRSTRVVGRDGNTFTVVGDLTVRGVTRPLELEIELDGLATNPMTNQQVIAFTAKGELDREEFGLTWNVALEGGGVLVSRKIQIDIEGEALRRA
jgi:polyisoprenoid-binding protein YceI